MNWAIFIHFYQPSNQRREVLENVVKTAYRPILALVDQYPSARISVNINACLTEQLIEAGYDDVVDLFKKLAIDGKIEFVASAKNHVFLPLVPEYEIELEIKRGIETNQQIFGDVYQPLGFFPTELAVSHKVAKVARQQGFSFILADEISRSGKLGDVSGQPGWWRKRYTVAGVKDLAVFFSNRALCHLVRSTPDLNVRQFNQKLTGVVAAGARESAAYLVSAHDAEAFGHHWPARHEILQWILEQSSTKGLSLCLLRDLMDVTKDLQEVELLKGTWETTEADLQQKRPFALWYDPENPIHQCQWQLAWKAIENLRRAQKRGEDPGSEAIRWARLHLTRGLHSCYFWWASCKPWWNPDMIVNGATELIKVIRTLNSLRAAEKAEAEEYYVRIIHLVWQWHWGGEAQRRINLFDHSCHSQH